MSEDAVTFEAAEAADAGETLVLDLDGFEGPLHVLLDLARLQKVDELLRSNAISADEHRAQRERILRDI